MSEMSLPLFKVFYEWLWVAGSELWIVDCKLEALQPAARSHEHAASGEQNETDSERKRERVGELK